MPIHENDDGGSDYEVVASSENAHNRWELRRFDDKWVMVHLRPRVGGGWYVRDLMTVPAKLADE